MSTTTTPDINQVMATIQTLMGQQAQVIQTLADGNRPRNALTDTRGIGRPGNFKGDQSKYKEWMMKLNAYLRTLNPSYLDWISQLIHRNEVVNEEMMNRLANGKNIDNVIEFNQKLYSVNRHHGR